MDRFEWLLAQPWLERLNLPDSQQSNSRAETREPVSKADHNGPGQPSIGGHLQLNEVDWQFVGHASFLMSLQQQYGVASPGPGMGPLAGDAVHLFFKPDANPDPAQLKIELGLVSTSDGSRNLVARFDDSLSCSLDLAQLQWVIMPSQTAASCLAMTEAAEGEGTGAGGEQPSRNTPFFVCLVFKHVLLNMYLAREPTGSADARTSSQALSRLGECIKDMAKTAKEQPSTPQPGSRPPLSSGIVTFCRKDLAQALLSAGSSGEEGEALRATRQGMQQWGDSTRELCQAAAVAVDSLAEGDRMEAALLAMAKAGQEVHQFCRSVQQLRAGGALQEASARNKLRREALIDALYPSGRHCGAGLASERAEMIASLKEFKNEEHMIEESRLQVQLMAGR